MEDQKIKNKNEDKLSENTDKIKGFKGFDKNLVCHGHQFKIGEMHEHERP